MFDGEVSGIITTYKREADMVEIAVKSMIDQTYPIKEIIVVDDNQRGSEFCEPLRKMCEKYPTVKYIKQNGNKGACAARNLGIENATGKYVAFLDDDDEWMPEKTEKQMKVFADHQGEGLGLVFCCGTQYHTDTGKTTDYYNIKVFKEVVDYATLLRGNIVGTTSAPLILKEVFYKVGMFWEEQPARQDYEMWVRIASAYGIRGVIDQLFVHTMHESDQISKNKKRSYIGYDNMYKRYKKDYKKDPEAEQFILEMIYFSRYKFSFAVTGVFLRIKYLKFKKNMKMIIRRIFKGKQRS